jgi:hypothetical protein
MGRKKVNKKQEARFIGIPLAKKICPCCKGSDGTHKEIYDTREDALQRAEYIRSERGVRLKVYQCSAGNGWHLTKDSDDSDINSESMNIPQNNYFPRSSVFNSKVEWEVIHDDAPNVYSTGIVVKDTVKKSLQKTSDRNTVTKVECKSGDSNISLNGVVVEIIENINLERIFNINLNNPIPAKLAKVFLDDEHQQITVHVKSGRQIKSYTALVKKIFLQKHKIKKGNNVNISIAVKSINNKSVWHCVSITRS